ncbi:hypothetical protein NBRC116188_00910 [Oceaniserpentilla sp. 4NH20-0058]|uniref:hypothetical protein n=1 Tax=Oceaniserpentilla sp. 4NH20-0058 TaxID=3127660 RepID=UPI0031037470
MPKYNNPRKTWFYSHEFKIKAVKLSDQPDIQNGSEARLCAGVFSQRCLGKYT